MFVNCSVNSFAIYKIKGNLNPDCSRFCHLYIYNIYINKVFSVIKKNPLCPDLETLEFLNVYGIWNLQPTTLDKARLSCGREHSFVGITGYLPSPIVQLYSCLYINYWQLPFQSGIDCTGSCLLGCFRLLSWPIYCTWYCVLGCSRL